LGKRRMAFGYAVQGLAAAFRRESHMRIHALAAGAAIGLGAWLQIGPWEWIAVTFCIGLVMICELVNTAIERLCDLVQPAIHPDVRYIKDVSAGFVLIACVVAVVTGVVVFG